MMRAVVSALAVPPTGPFPAVDAARSLAISDAANTLAATAATQSTIVLTGMSTPSRR